MKLMRSKQILNRQLSPERAADNSRLTILPEKWAGGVDRTLYYDKLMKY